MKRHHWLASLALIPVLGLVPTGHAQLAVIAPSSDEPPHPPPPPHAYPRRIAAIGPPSLLSRNLSSDFRGWMPADRAQLVAFYDGDARARPTLRLQCRNGRSTFWFGVSALPRSSQTGAGTIETREFAMNGCVPTGRVSLSGIIPDGVIDGVAFALRFKDPQGRAHIIRSEAADATRPVTVGLWPLAMTPEQFAAQTSHITDPRARQQARVLLFGAQYLGNGVHDLGLPRSLRLTGVPTH